jgi:hypothetical protein
MEEAKITTQESENGKSKVQQLKEDTADLFDHATDYIETFIQLKAVSAVEKGVNLASGIINGIIFAVLSLVAFLFIATGLAFWVGDLVNSRAGGFFIVAGFFIIVMIVIGMMRKNVILPLLRNFLTRKIYD